MSYIQNWALDKENINKVELVKLEKDGLDIIPDIINKYSISGYDSVLESDKILLKWSGIYEQKPKNGYFMMRVRINSGIMDSKQARVIASISSKYGRDIVKITSRGAIQFYWIKLEKLPEIFEAFEKVGLSTFESCGDCPRTIVGNPLAGVDKNELFDTTGIVKDLNDFFLLNRDFSNLPRKFKISISAGIYNSAHKEINDLSFTPAVKVINGNEIKGFNVWVGGGLSTKPIMAKALDIFSEAQNVLKVAIGVATLFRDFGYRKERNHARLKFLLHDWGSDKFKEKLIEITGELPTAGEDKTHSWNGAYFYGVHEQKQHGKSYVGINIPLGHLTSKEFLELVEIAETYGDGKLRTTMSQNIIISGIESSYVQELLQNPIFTKFSYSPDGFIGHMLSCTGSEYCNLAIVETKERGQKLAKFLDEKIKTEIPIKINIVGCPNSCGHGQISDIGLRGALLKSVGANGDASNNEAFDIFLGGILGPSARFNEKIIGRIKAENIHEVILDFVIFYNKNHNENEAFFHFVERVGKQPFENILNSFK